MDEQDKPPISIESGRVKFIWKDGSVEYKAISKPFPPTFSLFKFKPVEISALFRNIYACGKDYSKFPLAKLFGIENVVDGLNKVLPINVDIHTFKLMKMVTDISSKYAHPYDGVRAYKTEYEYREE